MLMMIGCVVDCCFILQNLFGCVGEVGLFCFIDFGIFYERDFE